MVENTIWRMSLALLFVCVVGVSGTAFAEDKAEKAEPEVNYNALLEKADNDARRGRYKRAIPVYKQVLRERPFAYPAVYYNLAELSRSLKNCSDARMLYVRYLEIQPEDPDKAAIEKRIKECDNTLTGGATITIKVEGTDDPIVIVNGIPVSSKTNTSLRLTPGKYELLVKSTDYITSRSVFEARAGGERELVVQLKKMSFFGTLDVKTNVEGVEIMVDGKSLGMSPLKEPVKVEAGKHFVELKKAGYHRWIRNVIVERDDDYSLEVNLQKQDTKP